MDLLVVATVIVRILAGGILLLAGVAKVRMGYREVLRAVVAYKILPYPMAKVWARVLPLLEAVLGAALIAGLFLPIVAAAAASLMVLITGAVAQAVVRNRRVACRCFGTGGSLVSWPIVVRNSVLITALVGLAIGGGNL
ncbi:MAG TPA: MauE/DoxX family redox-associated membrane protein [Candidatus Dormibacteraeota bacterium]|nr:MauE/DoxX family redox-associated membrane protein [Candidatus Dormibacteraeota bacterium]